MTKRLLNLFLIASYMLAVGTAALHTHDHGHHSDHESDAGTASVEHAHDGCPHHHPASSNGSKDDEHEHGPAYEHVCVLCSFLALNASIVTPPAVEQAGEVVNGFVWQTETNPQIAAIFSCQQRGPPAV